MLFSFTVAAQAQDIENYGVDVGDKFGYKLTTTIDGVSVVSMVEVTIVGESVVVGLTADYEYYNGSTTTEENEPCLLVLKQSEIDAYQEDTLTSQQRHADKFVDVFPVYDNQHFSEMRIDNVTGVAVSATGTDDDGNAVTWEIREWGDANLDVLYQNEGYASGGGGGDLPGFPFAIVSAFAVATIAIVLKKSKKN